MKIYTLSAIRYTLILAALLLMPIGCAYAWDGNDNADRLSNKQSSTFSPGYINAAKQRAYETINQQNQSKSWWDNLVDTIKKKTSSKIEEQANTKVEPEVKKKTSSNAAKSTTTTLASTTSIIDSLQYNVQISSGSSQYRDPANGRLVAEKIGDVWHVYAGSAGNLFSDSTGTSWGYDSLQAALDCANTFGESIVLVRGGVYGSAGTAADRINLQMHNGIRLYGGYDSNGNRDIDTHGTTIYGGITSAESITKTTEINGFTIMYGFQADSGSSNCISLSNSTELLKISNNKLQRAIFGIRTSYLQDKVVIFNNEISGNRWGIHSYGSSIVNSNRIYQNSVSGINTNGASIIENNRFWENGTTIIDSQVTIGRGTGGAIRNNMFYSYTGRWPMSISGTTNFTVENNIHQDRDVLYRTPGGNTNLTLGSNPKVYDLNPTNQIFTSSFYPTIGYQPTLVPQSYGQVQHTSTQTQSTITSTPNMPNPFSSDYHGNLSNANIYGSYAASMLDPNITGSRLATNLGSSDIASIFKALLANKGVLEPGMATPLNEAVVGRLVTKALTSAVGVPSLTATEGRNSEIQMALALANILKNPTEDQKLILAAIESLLADMKNIQEKAGINPALSKAENDLLQMVAAVLLAQGVPDLLKAGDIEGVKSIFKDLGASKDKIMLDYNLSIKPYYDNIVKELTANLNMLQLNGMLSKKLTEEELRDLEPREIDKILENIRRSNDKSFELAYILQQDAKYRKEYLDPSTKVLEEDMKTMMKVFTQKINKALEDKDKR